MTNEDVIDLYSRVKLGSPVVVIAPRQGDSPTTRAWRAWEAFSTIIIDA
jgi:hypothetical protein